MPNNSSARREKGRKKGERRRTVPTPLHKEDTASVDEARMDSVPHPLSLSGQEEFIMDTSSFSLSLAGAEKETPPMVGHDIMMNYYNSLSDDEKATIHVEALKANPGASEQELIEDKRATLWKAIHTAKVERKSQDENELYVRGPAQKAS